MTTYFVKNGGSDAADGLSDANAWETVGKVNGFSFTAGDTIQFNGGDIFRDTFLDNRSPGTSGNPVTFTSYGTGKAIFRGSDVLTDAAFRWIASASGTNEWYVELAAGGDPSLTTVKIVFLDDVRLSLIEGTLGSLSDHEWAWGDNDTLGFSTLYVADATGDPDTSGVVIEGGQRDFAVRPANTSFVTLDNLIGERANNNGIQFDQGFVGEVTNLIVQNCIGRFCWNHGIRILSGSTRTHRTILVDNCIANDNGSSGINAASYFNDLTVTNCEVFNNCFQLFAVTGPSGGIKTFTFPNDSPGFGDDITISNNRVYDNGNLDEEGEVGAGIYADTPGNNTIFEFNEVYGNGGRGIWLEFPDTFTGHRISYNLSYNNHFCGIFLTEGATGVKIYNNTCRNPNASGRDGDMNVRDNSPGPGQVTNNIIKNNICLSGFALRASGGYENDGTNGSGNVYENNILAPEATDYLQWGVTKYSTLAAWEAASGGGKVNNLKDDPLFTNPGSNDFTLRSGSPAIDAGLDVSLTEDFIGTVVPFGSFPDIGAYEWTPGLGLIRSIVRDIVNDVTKPLL